MRTARTLVALATAVLLSACAAADDPPLAPSDDAAADDEAPPVPDGGDGVGEDAVTDPDAADDPGAGADLDAAVDDAVADLAATTGVDPAAIEVRSAGPVTWSDGALGCPEPGMMYTQALVPGYRIVLVVGGNEVAYHGAEGAAPARCDDPRPPSDPGS